MKFRGLLLGLVLLGLASCGTRTIRDPGDNIGPLVGVWDSMGGNPAMCHERLTLNEDNTFWWFDKSGDFSGTYVLSEDQVTFLFAGGKPGEIVQIKVDAQLLEIFRAGVQTRYTKVPRNYADKVPCPSDRVTVPPKTDPVCKSCGCKSCGTCKTTCKTSCKTTCKRSAGKIQETFVPLDTASFFDDGLGTGDRCETTRDLDGSLGLLCWNPKPPPPPPPPQPPVPPPPCPPPPVPTPTPQPPVPCTNASCTSTNNNTNNNTNTNTNTNPVNVNINISGGTCTNCPTPTPTPTVTPTPPCPDCPDCPPPSPKQKPPKPDQNPPKPKPTQTPCPECQPCPPVEDDCCCCDCCEETCTTTTTTTCSCQ